MKRLQMVEVNKQNAILIIVDVQNEFCKPGGKHYSGKTVQILPKVIGAISNLAEQMRKADIPIIYVQSVRTHEEPEFTVFGIEPILKIGTWASEIVDELKPQVGDIVIQKYSHDPFFRPDLDNKLKEIVPEPTHCCAIVTGGQLNVCVYHTILGFHMRHYWTVVPVDCVYYPNDDARNAALELLSYDGPYPNIILSRSNLIEMVPMQSSKPPTFKLWERGS